MLGVTKDQTGQTTPDNLINGWGYYGESEHGCTGAGPGELFSYGENSVRVQLLGTGTGFYVRLRFNAWGSWTKIA